MSVTYIKSMDPTPNPNSYKITMNLVLLKDDMWEAEGSATDPLPHALFQIGVAKVFIHEDMIVVSKRDDDQWDALLPAIGQVLDNFFATSQAVFATTRTTVENDTIELIQEVIRDYIQPSVANDGGMIRLHDFRDGVVYVSMHGACDGCPSATNTLRDGVERIIKFAVPGVDRVELCNR